jgi:TLD
LVDSKCISDRKQKEYLLKLLGNRRLVTILLFVGSISGWEADDFHSRCDDKGPTITLMKIRDGDCIGGYTNSEWSSDYEYVRDFGAILFNLSTQTHFNNT